MIKGDRALPRRTFGMWVIFALFLITVLMGGLRVSGAISQAAFLRLIAESINIPYLIISGILTALGGMVGILCIFLRKVWVPKTVMIAAASISVLYWFDQYVFVENTNYIDSAWGFSLLINVFILGGLAWMLTRKRVQAYYENGK